MDLHSIINDIEIFNPSSPSSSSPSSTSPSSSSLSLNNSKYDTIFTKYKHCCPNGPSNIFTNNWNEGERKKLKAAVKRQLSESNATTTKSSAASAAASSSSSSSSSSNAVDVPITLSLSSSSSSSSILNNAANNSVIDWTRIASVSKMKRSPFECMMQYRNNDDSTINKEPWSVLEESHLKDLAHQYNQCYWVDIANALNTRRTPWDCLKHYQQVLNTTFVNTSEWTEEEDLQLRNAIQEYGLKNWYNVSNCIPGRSTAQCTYRWRTSIECHDSLVAGYWTEEENRKLFLAALRYKLPLIVESCKSRAEIDEFLRAQESKDLNDPNINAIDDSDSDIEIDNDIIVQRNKPTDDTVEIITRKRKSRKKGSPNDDKKDPNWIDVALLVGTKDATRCRERWVNYLDPTLNFEPFTPEEDKMLLKFVKNFGVGNWSTIAKWMPGRTDRKLMNRWKRLDEYTVVKTFKENNEKKRQRLITPKLNRREVNTSLTESDYVKVLKIKDSDDASGLFSKVL